jgi:hypothetical protein
MNGLTWIHIAGGVFALVAGCHPDRHVRVRFSSPRFTRIGQPKQLPSLPTEE